MEKTSLTPRPLRLALIGAGIYARDAHIPSLRNLGDQFEIVAVFSRTAESAAARIAEIQAFQPETVIDAYTNLAALFARDDIDAVDIVLPIHLLPAAIEQALAAGKHIISEKPIAPDVATGKQLLKCYTQHAQQVWMVAENWRYESAYRMAAEIVARGEIGQPRTCHWALHLPITPETKYYKTAWRHGGTVAGGWILDGGVHHVAVLRATMGEIDAVSAVATSHSSLLQPPDTISATLHFVNGAVGTYLATYASKAAWWPELFIVGEQGSLRVTRDKIVLTKESADPQTIACPKFDGVELELAAFGRAIHNSMSHLNTPPERLRDVAVVEAMMRAAEQGVTVYVDELLQNPAAFVTNGR